MHRKVGASVPERGLDLHDEEPLVTQRGERLLEEDVALGADAEGVDAQSRPGAPERCSGQARLHQGEGACAGADGEGPQGALIEPGP